MTETPSLSGLPSGLGASCEIYIVNARVSRLSTSVDLHAFCLSSLSSFQVSRLYKKPTSTFLFIYRLVHRDISIHFPLSFHHLVNFPLQLFVHKLVRQPSMSQLSKGTSIYGKSILCIILKL